MEASFDTASPCGFAQLLHNFVCSDNLSVMTTASIDLEALEAQITADFEQAQERAREEFKAQRARRHEATAQIVAESENVARLRAEFAAAMDRHEVAWAAAIASGLSERDLASLRLDPRVKDARRLLDPPRARGTRKLKSATKPPAEAQSQSEPESENAEVPE